MNHRVGRVLFASIVGLGVAVYSYQWITDPLPRQQRAIEERAVNTSRELLIVAVDSGELEIVDPLSPNRKVGKVYIYPENPGWAVSGHYRRDEDDRWHAYLIRLTEEFGLAEFEADDKALVK